ncbi:MAG: tRNA (adenosine(37)-N6)-threonylcarbamoyltransferase complex dimerization subunit type 1 TsaB [Clostridiales bacterium]|nr:tRNA (adenosine(37)-N6)-threonylcarbamoyltransferase complex dimerization subunit type 1 TsaB [Clostridiales bacterium]
MKILGIESSSLVASVALLQDEILIAEYTVNYKRTHSQTLLPMLDEIVQMTETELEDLDGIAVSAGPGSFTGLRIGSATAKGLGLALNKPLLAVPTVDAMAYQLYGCSHWICPIMDAKRGQVYTGIYRFEREFEVLKPECAMDLGELIEEIRESQQTAVFLGDGVPVGKEQIIRELGDRALFAPAPCGRQRAAAVAALGTEYLKAGRMQTAAEHAPEYLRMSQAERELAAKKKRQSQETEQR